MERPLLNQSQAAQRLGLSPNTLRRWRYEGRGPEWVTVGSRAIRYSEDALFQFIAAGRRNLISGRSGDDEGSTRGSPGHGP
jgi:predicted site-specific integrase-resolvase